MTPATLEKIRQAVAIMDEELAAATNLTPIDRKVIAYWTVGTYSLPVAKKYPLLQILGPTCTGKTQILTIINNLARLPQQRSLRGLSDAVLRDFLASTHKATAILEEADSGWRTDSLSFEGILKDRYSVDGMKWEKRTENKNGHGWDIEYINLFGATVLHRQKPFNDASLDTRRILIRTVPNLKRKYERLTNRGAGMLANLEVLTIPELNLDLPQRIVECYAPVLGLASLLDDLEFLQALTQKLRDEAELSLQEAQESEPTLLVLRGLMAHVFAEGTYDTFVGQVKLSALAKWLLAEHSVFMTPRQVGAMVRGLGIEVKISHGISSARPQPLKLLKACREYGLTDDEAYKKLEQICQVRVEGVEQVADIKLSLKEREGGNSTISTHSPDDVVRKLGLN